MCSILLPSGYVRVMHLVCSILLPNGYVGAAYVLKMRNSMDGNKENKVMHQSLQQIPLHRTTL